MAKKPFLKTKLTREKFVVELDLADVLAVVKTTNRELRQSNREIPNGGAPQFRITNPHQLFRFVAHSLFHPPRGTYVDPLPKYLKDGIYHAVWAAAEKGVGAVEEPDPDCPASVAEYAAVTE
ncbi:MAG: hypothetical protein PCFJNLEI_03100 [Verrucomicrobiae bacterium]|nr:hypothetical protein [Verrucomicrobiae bacterium]